MKHLHPWTSSEIFLGFFLIFGISAFAKADFACDKYPGDDVKPRSAVHTTGISYFDSSAKYYRKYGVCFPSFNNTIDTRGYGDERNFLRVMRQDSDGVHLDKRFVDAVAAKPGEFVSFGAFIANDGLDDPRVTATGVTTLLGGFSKNSQGQYVTPYFRERAFVQSISGENTIPLQISDSATVSSGTEKKIRLRYLPGNIFITSAGKENSKMVGINPSEFLDAGAIIGSIGQERSGEIKGGSLDNTMYTFAVFLVEEE